MEVKMTYREILKSAVGNWEGEDGSIKALVRYAYYQGFTHGVRRVCDKHTKIIAEARKQASQKRYHKMAESCLPETDEIYDPEYNGDYANEYKNDKITFNIED